jgi:uncharacterized protein
MRLAQSDARMRIHLFLPLLLLALTAATSTMTPPQRLEVAVRAYEARDYRIAKTQLTVLADQGSAIAETLLGTLYLHGRGVTADPATATAYFYRAAQRGYAPAQLALSSAYERGSGTAADRAEAYFWAQLAGTRAGGQLQTMAVVQAAALGSRITPGERKTLDQRATRWRPWSSAGR